MFRPMLFRFATLILASGALAFAAPAPSAGEPFTAKELAQGFRDHVIVARPHDRHRGHVDADEAREGVRVRERFARLGDLRVIELDGADTADAAIARLQATGRYEFVERDHIRHLDATPNDPRFSDLWGLSNTGASGGVAGADIKALAAWDIIHDAPNVIVAVVDSGVNLTHQDIVANLWRNPSPSAANDVNGANFYGGRGSIVNGNPADDNGHGTHVAGTIGAVGNNGVAVTGVAWRVQLMVLKALGGSAGTGSTTDIVAAINYAVTHGAHIINASFGESGGSGFSQSELAAITAAQAAGVIFVAAAGNDTANMDISPHYPASHPLDNIVSVGASQRNDFVSTFSNYGAAVDLFAPGESIVSLNYASNTGVATLSGTSMATPHVAGALALLKAQFPTDTYRQLINRLLRGVDPGSRFTGYAQTGGRLNLLNALLTANDADGNRPFNDKFASRAHLVGNNFLVRSSNVGATADASEPAHAGFPGGASLWWEWTPSSTSAVRITTTGSKYDTLLAIYTGGAVNALTPVASNDNDGTNLTSRIDFTAQAGVTYQIVVDGKNGATGLTLLNVGSVPANDSFASPVVLNGASDSVLATNANCTRETGEPRILNFTGGTSLWYQWTAPRSGRFQFAVTSTDFDPLLAIYTGSSLSTLALVTSNDNISTTNTSSLCTVDAVAGTTYRISVDAKSAIGQFVLTLNDSLWQAATTNNVTGAPAVAPDGTVYAGSTDNSLYAFAADGTLKWSKATGGLIDTCSPAIGNDGTVYVGSNDGLLYAFGPDGTQKWTHSFNTGSGTTAVTNPAGNSPAIGTDGTIYIKTAEGSLHAINPADGSEKWNANVNSPLASFYGSPVIAPDGTIYQGSDESVGTKTDSALYAINPDGTRKWRFATDSGVYATPALDAAGNIYVCTLNGGVYCVTPAGTQRWRVTSGGNISSSPALSADGATLYYGGYDKVLYARRTDTGTVSWTLTLGNEVRASSPAVDANGNIYLGCYDSKIYVVSSAGALVKTWATGLFIRSCPTIAGTTLYCGSNDDKLYAFDLGTGVASGPWSQYRANARRLGRAVSEVFAIATPPQSQTVVAGLPFTLSVAATGSGAISYQWSKDGTAIAGATSASYAVSAANFANAGQYTVTVTSGSSTLTSLPATVTVVPLNPGRLTNLSVRTTAGTGTQTLTVGFVLSGSPDKAVLIRAIGPSLAQFGLTGVLDDPQLQLFSGTTVLATNDNWATPAAGTSLVTASTFASVGAFPLADASRDAALLRVLPSGSYTAQITAAGTTGLALAELYDTAATTGARLVNVSARAQVGTGGGILIAGFAINGNVPKRVLIRGIGPSLSQFGVTGRLADPLLAVFDSAQRSVATNDDWGGGADLTAAFTSVGAFSLSSPSSLDAALILTLAPGSYTAQVSGVNSTTGVALVEVYELP